MSNTKSALMRRCPYCRDQYAPSETPAISTEARAFVFEYVQAEVCHPCATKILDGRRICDECRGLQNGKVIPANSYGPGTTLWCGRCNGYHWINTGQSFQSKVTA